MTEITIKVPAIPNETRGTKHWVLEKLNEMEKTLRIKEGFPAVVVLEDKEIAWVDHDYDYDEEYDNLYQCYGVVRFLYPVHKPERDRRALFSGPLSPSAIETVDEFLNEVAAQLDSRWAEV
jgi:hypothetical protein